MGKKRRTEPKGDWRKDFLRILNERRFGCWDDARAIKEPNLPRKIYKYRKPSPLSWGLLTSGQLHLAPPKNFNDPLDSHICFDPRPYLLEYRREPMMQRFVPKGHPERNALYREKTWPDFINRLAPIAAPNGSAEALKAQLAELYIYHEKRALERRDEMSRAFRVHTKVCSVTANVRSVIMWTHYADEHKGFCLEYTLEGLPAEHPARHDLYPVFYGTKRFDVSPWGVPTTDGFTQAGLPCTIGAMHKSHHWAYEEEWRIIRFQPDTDEGITVEVPKPSAIYLGMFASEEVEREARRIVPEMPVYRMKLADYEYAMDVVPV
jgi:hypothetical protein